MNNTVLTATKEIPILFKTDMVQAILSGTKTQTRRIVKVPIRQDDEFHNCFPVPKGIDTDAGFAFAKDITKSSLFKMHCPYGKVGDVLWVRESFLKGYASLDKSDLRYYIYRDGDQMYTDGNYAKSKAVPTEKALLAHKWKPSIHMPKEAARIWLQVTDIRVERLQSISESDAIAEGIEKLSAAPLGKPLYMDYMSDQPFYSAIASYGSLWCSINGLDAWVANPFVWVVSFKVLSTTGKPHQ